MAIAALVVWMCTAAIGGYLLATSSRMADAADTPEATPVEVPARSRDRFDPPSLVRAKSEPLPGMRAAGEFAHPALAVIGLGLWFGYVLSRDRIFAVIGLGVLLGALCAGISWALANARAARRAAAGHRPGRPGVLLFTPRLLILHGLGAALTLLLTALIAARA